MQFSLSCTVDFLTTFTISSPSLDQLCQVPIGTFGTVVTSDNTGYFSTVLGVAPPVGQCAPGHATVDIVSNPGIAYFADVDVVV